MDDSISIIALAWSRDKRNTNDTEDKPDVAELPDHLGHSHRNILRVVVDILRWIINRLILVWIDDSGRDLGEDKKAKTVSSQADTRDEALPIGKVLPNADQRRHVDHATACAIQERITEKVSIEALGVSRDKVPR